MVYITPEKIDKLIALLQANGLRADPKFFETIKKAGRIAAQEADERIAQSIWDGNEAVGWWLSLSNMGELEQHFVDLYKIALKKLGVTHRCRNWSYDDGSSTEQFDLELANFLDGNFTFMRKIQD